MGLLFILPSPNNPHSVPIKHFVPPKSKKTIRFLHFKQISKIYQASEMLLTITTYVILL